LTAISADHALHKHTQVLGLRRKIGRPEVHGEYLIESFRWLPEKKIAVIGLRFLMRTRLRQV
jgi:hypothetical protein